MSKVHPEAFVEWTATASGTTAATASAPAAQAPLRQFFVTAVISITGTLSAVGSITFNFGASRSWVIHPFPGSGSGGTIVVTFNKAIRCDINFQLNVVATGFTGATNVDVNIGGYQVRE